MNKSENPNLFNVPDERESGQIRDLIFNTFNDNLGEFLRQGLTEKRLIVLQFIPSNRGMLTYANGNRHLLVHCDDLRQRFLSRIEFAKDSNIPLLQDKNYVTVADQENLPSGLKPFIGKRFWLATTIIPIVNNGGTNIAIYQESYHDPIAKDRQDPKVELWTAKRIQLPALNETGQANPKLREQMDDFLLGLTVRHQI